VAIPETKEALEAAGWVFDNEGRCRACREPIEWWISPAGKKAPMTVQVKKDGEGFFAKSLGLIRVSHFAVCPNADEFRRKK
jgi:hypothetical protein